MVSVNPLTHLQVTQRLEFSCCYLRDTELNAHRYRLEVTVESPTNVVASGVVMDFQTLKRYMQALVFDETFLFSRTDLSKSNLKSAYEAFNLEGVKTELVDFDLCAESLCTYFALTLQRTFDEHKLGVNVVDVKLRENNDSYANWHR